MIPVEIERKFVVAMPDLSALAKLDGYSSSEIEQTYLAARRGITRRVRARRYADKVVYTETKKARIDEMSSREKETELTEDVYKEMLADTLPGTVTIRKTRHTFPYRDHTVEVDVYPNWTKSCIVEIELKSRLEKVEFPDFLHIIAEVTGDERYTNASMAREFPDELV